MRRFEYMIHTRFKGDSFEDVYLNEMGVKGWELVTVRDALNGGDIIYYWKRELNEVESQSGTE